MPRRGFRHEKHKTEYKSFERDDFSYWDPYYVDSETVQKYKRNIEFYEPLDEAPTTESSGDQGVGVESLYTPAVVLTGVFGAAFIILPFFVKKGPNRGIIQCSIMLTVFCMWIFWVTVYIGQMNPLMGPRLENTSVAWIAHKIGNAVVRVGANSTL